MGELALLPSLVDLTHELELNHIAGDSMMEVDSDASFASPPPTKGKKAAPAAKSKAKAPAKSKKKALVSSLVHRLL